LITWDKNEISPAVFERRLEKARRVISERQLSALVVYSELWRSNQARFLSNYMPYFNRALLIIPLEQPPILLCGLTPRVYGWIRSVSIIEDIRPAGNFAMPLFQLASERNWTRIGILDDRQLPSDIFKAIHSGTLEVVNVDSATVFSPGDDETELAMRRKAAAMAKEILAEELPKGVGIVDHRFAGALEKRFRMAGVEDLITLLTNGRRPPAPPMGTELEENYSVSLAVEYRGHWIRLSRPQASAEVLLQYGKRFEEFLRGIPNPLPGKRRGGRAIKQLVRRHLHKRGRGGSFKRIPLWYDYPAPPAVVASPQFLDGAATLPVPIREYCLESLSGPYPYEVGSGSIFALHLEFRAGDKRLFYGDTCCYSESGSQPL
jgi:hypothetical protein